MNDPEYIDYQTEYNKMVNMWKRLKDYVIPETTCAPRGSAISMTEIMREYWFTQVFNKMNELEDVWSYNTDI